MEWPNPREYALRLSFAQWMNQDLNKNVCHYEAHCNGR